MGCEHSGHVVANAYASSFTLRVAQNADHLTPNSPFSLLFGEVVCILCATPFRLPARRGELHYMRVRHAGDTLSEGLV